MSSPSNYNDLTGQKFERLTVIARAENSPSGMTKWLCRCDCGAERIVFAKHLRSGATKSCGCFSADLVTKRNFKHGQTNTRLFSIWQNMKDRCFNPNNDKYSYYGGRGITVCKEWVEDFMNFYNWAMSNGYEDRLTIDRIDNNKNYEPSNCRWATIICQANNKRSNRVVSYNGEDHTLAEWSRILKINSSTLGTRFHRDKKTSGEELFEKVGK